MKKILSVVAIAATMLFTTTASAQHTTPRYGTAPNQNKTFSGLAIQHTALADVALMDTLKITPKSYKNNYIVTVTDTVVLALKSVGDCFLYDEMNITLENTSGANHFVYFLGTAALATKWRMASTGTTITLASAKAATLTFRFNGVYWYEVSRCVQ